MSSASNHNGTASRSPAVRRVVAQDTQQVCIDLPGEEVRCYVYKPKLEIMLRKHRDVIFDIQLFRGMQYTVEADTSDFYNARDKKVVLFARKQKVLFTDGQRLHLWVGRAFKGSLMLKANGKLIGRYNPTAMDCNRYDDAPTTKPAPLIVVLRNDEAAFAQTQKVAGLSFSAKPLELPTAAARTPSYPSLNASPPLTQEPTQTMHVVEVRDALGNMPQEIADFFKKGGEDTAVDGNKLVTRNWLWAQITSAAAYLGDNNPWIKELWNQKFYLKRIKGRVNIIFKGSPALRAFLTGTRYLSDHPKIIAISAGAGSIGGTHKASWEATKGSFKGAAKFALIFTITLDVAEWLADYEDRDPATGKPKRDLFDLGAKVFTDVLWAAVGAAVGSFAMGAVVAFMSLAVGVPVMGALVVVGAIGFALVAGYGLAALDAGIGATPFIAKVARESAAYLDRHLPRDYVDYEKAVNSMMLGGSP